MRTASSRSAGSPAALLRDLIAPVSADSEVIGEPSANAPAVRGHEWPGASLGWHSGKLKDSIHAITRGLPFQTLETLAASSGMTLPELASLLGIPARTLARRKTAGKLSFEESERVFRLATVFEKAVRLFDGNAADALQWLRTPKKALDGENPLDYSKTELGAREVEKLIGRMEHGVFS